MTISNFVAYVKQAWKNKPDTSTPLSADRLLHIEDGIKGNSDAIEAIAAAVVSQIVNDPDKIASMAALYAVDKKIGNVADLPNGAADVVAAITQQNSNLNGMKCYNRLSQLGLSSGASINSVLAKMPLGSIAMIYSMEENLVSGLPVTQQCNLIIFKTGYVFMVLVHNIWTGALYTATYNDVNTVGKFVQLAMVTS